MRIIFILLFSSISFLCISQDNTISGDLFEIKFPDKPEKSSQNSELNNINVNIDIWQKSYDPEEDKNLLYLVSESEYPSNYIHSDSTYELIDEFINSTISDLTENPDYELLSSNLDFKDGYLGKTFKFKAIKINSRIIVKTYLVNNYLIETMVITSSENWFSYDNDEFFDSFKIIKTGTNKKKYNIPYIAKQSYTIEIPGELQEQDFHADSQWGLVHMKIKMVESSSKDMPLFFMSSEAKYFIDPTLTIGLEELYQLKIEGSVKSTNADLIKKVKIPFDDSFGYEYYGSIQNGDGYLISRIFIKNNQFYMIMVISDSMKKNKNIDDFFNSFKLID